MTGARVPKTVITGIVACVVVLSLTLLIPIPQSRGLSGPSELLSPDGFAFQADPSNLTLKSPHAQSDGEFGYSVSSTATRSVVGAPDENVSGHYEAGQAYIYNATTGTLIYTLKSPNPQSHGYFGYSVAISSAIVVVGGLQYNSSGVFQAGCAYVFNVTTGKLVHTLKSPNAMSDGWFGYSVAIGGAMIAVGAPGETVAEDEGAGHAYIFNETTGKRAHTLTSSNAQSGGSFGWSVAVSDTTVVVGALYETASGFSEAGHAYIFNATTGKHVRTLTSPNAQSNGYFGSRVAISGAAALVSAPFETALGYAGAGHAYVFSSTTGNLILTLTSPNAQDPGYFGWGIAISASRLAVGAPFEAAKGYSYAGHTYVFNATTGLLVETLTSPHAQAGGRFGNSVAIVSTAVIAGACDETASGYTYAGHAYVIMST